MGIYSREIIRSLSHAHPETEFLLCYRPHRLLRSCRERLPRNCRRRLLMESRLPAASLLHGLNQRLPEVRAPRTVATFHDLFVMTGDYSSGDFRRRFSEQARQAAARSDLIITVSQFTAGQVERLLGVGRDRLRVVPHGVRLPELVPAVSQENIILHVGAIQRRKNIHRLVEAFEMACPEWRLVLAGSLGFGAQEILARIARSPARDRIELPGYVSQEEMWGWYARARIFAFPSLDEGFGMPVLDAMSRGVPVITSNRSALPEVAGDAALLVDPDDSTQIASALQELAGDSESWNHWRRRGLQRAREFSWEKAGAATWAVYKELLR